VRLDLNIGKLTGPYLQSEKEHDKSIQLEQLPAGALRIADLSFFSLKDFKALNADGIYWLSRVKSLCDVYDEDGKRWDLVSLLEKHCKDRMDMQICLGVRERVPCRLNFHLVKDRPLGISPLFVRRNDQITGLTHLLTLGLRVLTLIEIQVRRKLNMTGEQLSGLYEGQPSIQTARPTGVRLLKAFARFETTLTRVELENQCFWHITPLSSLQEQILSYLGLSTSIYICLIENSS